MTNRLLAKVAWIVVWVATAAFGQDAAQTPLEFCWFALSTNLLVEKNVADAETLLERAAKAGYNGVVLSDSKFMRWDQLPEEYAKNVRRVRAACRSLKIKCIVGVCPIGYSNDLLSRDPNLAEGLPVVDAPFLAKDGRLATADDLARLANGSFEQSANNMPMGWSFADQPGTITTIDTDVKSEGRCSLRMHDIGLHDTQNGHGRVCQSLVVKPFRHYHVSAAVKTQDFESAGDVRIVVLGKDGAALTYHQPRVEPTQDWKRLDITFNSLDNSEVRLYLGVWGGKRGTIWWDDVRTEPAGLLNVVRRAGAPLRVTSLNGKIVYEEERDFAQIRDPKLGVIPWPGEYTVWHDPPTLELPRGSRIRPDQTVLMSYCHAAIVYEGQVMCCMAEPKVYDILRWQIREVRKNLDPDGYFLQHDEIRSQGWDASCQRSGKTPGELLVENVRRCAALVRREAPGKPIYVWSDMFDPHHNAAKTGSYYLVKGDGPWFGSWNGLDKAIVVVNWNSAADKRQDSMRHFADLGHRQILAGYYDGPIEAITPWLRDGARTGGVAGAMYTTWRSDFGNLEAFARELNKR